MSDRPRPDQPSDTTKRELLARLLKKRVAADRVHPVSPGQAALWFLHQIAPTTAAYNVAIPVWMRSRLDVPAMQRAWAGLVSRHEALRMTIEPGDGPDGIPVQRVHERAEAVVDVVDASDLDADQLHGRVVSAYVAPFDLQRGPLARMTLVRRSAMEHVLLVTIHHIACDGSSAGILLDELLAFYEAEVEGRPPTLPPVQARYADFVRWQAEMLAGPTGREHLQYWEGELAGRLTTLDLPTDRPRRPGALPRGATHHLRFTPELTATLRRRARANGVTLYTVLLAAFQAILHRHTGQPQILVGSPTAGRSQPRFERVVGYFVNPVVLRADFAGGPTFATHLERVRETVLAALRHADYPFPLVVQQLQPERDSARSSGFQVMFNLMRINQFGAGMTRVHADDNGDASRASALGVEPYPLDQLEGQFELALELIETPTALFGALKYDADLYDADRIARMAGHLGTLLEAVAVDPSRPVTTLPLLSSSERAQLLRWNDTEAPVSDACAHDLVKAQARQTPDAVAVGFAGHTLTYRQLEARVTALAGRLRRLGVGPDVLVGLCVERSLDMVVGLLAILEAGGAYVPLDPAHPRERLAFMLRDADIRVLVTQEHLEHALPAHTATVVTVEGEPIGDAATTAATAPGLDNLAYTIYTSGSTGHPKGVQIPHRALANLLQSMRETPGLGSSDVLLAVTTLSFDIATLELLLPLVVGARVEVVSREVAADGARLARALRESGATVMQATPATWQMLLDAGWTGGAGFRILCGGEAMSRVLADRLLACGEVWNLYGPTETTIWSTLARVAAGADPVPIGRPIANTRIHVLDPQRQPVPVGVPGELGIGGTGVARGYLNRRELTADRFVEDVWSGTGRARVYLTGDVVRWREDGSLEYLGRMDQQVKLRGYRIETGEIEATLRGAVGVREVVVVAREDPHGDRRLVAYVLPDADADVSVSRLREIATERLPDYMVPSGWVFVSSLPLTANGKIDRRALPAVDQPERSAHGTVAPRTPVEALVAATWGEVLGLDAVGVEDNFFELGGHSLLAAQVVSRLRARLEMELPVRALFEAPTVEGLAALLQAGRGQAPAPAGPALVRVQRDQPTAVSFAQERLWFFDRYEPASTTFNMFTALRLAGPLDATALERSLDEIWRRHEALRTTFDAVDGFPVQRIAPPTPVPLPVTDLSHLDEAGRRAALGPCLLEHARQAFDLVEGPLAWARLVRLESTEHVLILSAHHIIADGWSMEVLARELRALYPAVAAGTPSPLEALPVQYADYTAWQRESMEGAAPDAALAYWRQRLAGVPPLALPTDRRRPARQTFRGTGVPRRLSPELSEQLRALGRREGTTLFMTLLAGFKALLARHAGQDDFVVGAAVAGRTRPELEPLIGFFLNTLALRTDLSGDPPFREVLARTRETTLEALAHQEVPFEKVLEALRLERDLSRTPLFQVFFNLLNFPRPGPAEPSALTIGPLTQDLASMALDLPAKFDLTLYAVDQPEGIALLLLYNADLFEATTAQSLVDQLERVLTVAASVPDTPLSRLPLVDHVERPALAVLPRAAFTPFPLPGDAGSIPDRFHAIVRQNADRVAIDSRRSVWTYAELDARVRRLGSAVRATIGHRGARVGLLLEHEAEMVAALLGVLDSGNAYVPLDPLYPRERLAFMLADSEAELLVTNSRHLELARALSADAVRVVNLDDMGPDPGTVDPAPVPPDSLAYILYTSGSTGQPKGVMQSHRNVLHHIGAYTDNLQLTREDRVALLASFSFDAAVMDVFGALLNGGTLCMWDVREQGVDGVPGWLEGRRVTVYHSTPTLYRTLLVGLTPTTSFPEVRLVVLGGEEAVRGDVELYRRHFSERCLLVNGLGPTESTVSFQHVLDRDTPITGTSIPVGRPVRDTELVLLDGRGAPTPLSGEIGIRSPFVALGYWRRPDLTAEAFLPDPDGGARRIYRTGDLGRVRPDGTLEYLGRRDDQVKIRGVRIEPAEVEAAIDSHPDVERCVVVGRVAQDGERFLAAYVIGAGGPAPTAGALQAYLRERLPAPMVPSAFVELEAMPLTPSGKVDRRALPAPGPVATTRARVHVAPRTPTEEAVAAIWCEVLGVTQVGVHDDFFELGGHSLMATRVLARVRARLEAEILLRALFEAPTIADVAALVDAARTRPAVLDDREELVL